MITITIIIIIIIIIAMLAIICDHLRSFAIICDVLRCVAMDTTLQQQQIEIKNSRPQQDGYFCK